MKTTMKNFFSFIYKLVLTILNFFFYKRWSTNKHNLYVNYHFTRQCNYKCGFCFHTAKTSFKLNIDDAKKGLKLLSEYGLEKINFAGGEPFLIEKGKYLGEMLKYCKETLKIPMCSVVTNGSLVTEQWFEKYGPYLDMMAVSIDSFNEQVNITIGRHQNGKNHVSNVHRISELCKKYNVIFKINTVVNTYNWNENMTEYIKRLQPKRWKVFQCLLIEGENYSCDSTTTLRDAQKFVIEKQHFQHFIKLHQEVNNILVPEDNETMRNSYLILDEYMRFLDCSQGAKTPSLSILDVGVSNALNKTYFDEIAFIKRGGKLHFSKGNQQLQW